MRLISNRCLDVHPNQRWWVRKNHVILDLSESFFLQEVCTAERPPDSISKAARKVHDSRSQQLCGERAERGGGGHYKQHSTE